MLVWTIFYVHKVAPLNQTLFASMHSVGEAQLWYPNFKKKNKNATWEELKHSIRLRFGITLLVPQWMLDTIKDEVNSNPKMQNILRLIQTYSYLPFIEKLTKESFFL